MTDSRASSDLFGLSRNAVRDWEQNVRRPEKAARTLLLVIGRGPPGGVERVRDQARG